MPRERKPTFFATRQGEEDPETPIAGLRSEVVPTSVKVVVTEENKEVHRDLGALFEQNNWEAKFGGLFTGMGELKKSIQTGKEVGWSEAARNNRELNLLDQFGKDLQTSQLKEPESPASFT